MKVSTNLTIEEHVKNIGMKYAETLGMSLSAFVSMCIMEYDFQNRSLDMAGELRELISRIDAKK